MLPSQRTEGGFTRAVAVIPARYASTRFPGKPLADLLGRPMIAWVVAACLEARSLAGVYVATDHEGIADAARKAGATAVMTPPDLASGTDRVALAAEGIDADVFINVQGDEPAIDPRDLDLLAGAFGGANPPRMATLARAAGPGTDFSSPDVVKLVRARNGDALYFSRCAIPYRRDAEGGAPTLIHVGVYAYTAESLKLFARMDVSPLERTEKLEQLRALEAGWRIRVLDALGLPGVGVDRPEDMARATALLLERGFSKCVPNSFS